MFPTDPVDIDTSRHWYKRHMVGMHIEFHLVNPIGTHVVCSKTVTSVLNVLPKMHVGSEFSLDGEHIKRSLSRPCRPFRASCTDRRQSGHRPCRAKLRSTYVRTCRTCNAISSDRVFIYLHGEHAPVARRCVGLVRQIEIPRFLL